MKVKVSPVPISVGENEVVFYPPAAMLYQFRVLEQRAKEKHNGNVSVEISNIHVPRTTGVHSQNRHLNGHIRQIAEYTGDDFDYLKYQVKMKAITRGWPSHFNNKGDIVPNKEPDVDTVQISAGIDVCHEIAAELGMKLEEA